VAPSPHLSWEELACHDKHRTPYPVDYRPVPLERLVTGFEELRAAVSREVGRDSPLAVLSAYRTPEYNRAIGGEDQSWHVKGCALDLSCGRALSVLEFALIAVRTAKSGGVIRGVGFYPDNGFVHMDVRPTKGLALWRVVVKQVHGKPTSVTLPWSGEGYE
jgi:hypothetical protein